MLLPSITPLQKGLALKETSEAQVWLSMSEGFVSHFSRPVKGCQGGGLGRPWFHVLPTCLQKWLTRI